MSSKPFPFVVEVGLKKGEKERKERNETTCCLIFIYERSSHKNAQFAYQKENKKNEYIQQQKLNNVVQLHNIRELKK